LSTPHAPSHGHSKRGFATGSILSIILTVIPFWLVTTGALHNVTATTVTIFVLAIIQIAVHVTAFLNVDARSEGGWTLLAFVFTAILVVITIIGSIWVMYHLDSNMMPMSVDAMRGM
jgi:cytochrome o ubiquinol oxidase operon protein cyoD